MAELRQRIDALVAAMAVSPAEADYVARTARIALEPQERTAELDAEVRRLAAAILDAPPGAASARLAALAALGADAVEHRAWQRRLADMSSQPPERHIRSPPPEAPCTAPQVGVFRVAGPRRRGLLPTVVEVVDDIVSVRWHLDDRARAPGAELPFGLVDVSLMADDGARLPTLAITARHGAVGVFLFSCAPRLPPAATLHVHDCGWRVRLSPRDPGRADA